MNRRNFLFIAGGVAVGPLLLSRVSAEREKTNMSGPKIVRSEEEWRELLTPEQFQVLRKEGTEPSFTSPLNDEKRPGTFVCAGCDNPLFTAEMKYDSGTGWPSFFTYIEGSLGTKTDFKLIYPRTEYHCARCDGHQGHVFKDGPELGRLKK